MERGRGGGEGARPGPMLSAASLTRGGKERERERGGRVSAKRVR